MNTLLRPALAGIVVLAVALPALAGFDSKTKKFSCKDEADGDYVNPASCTGFANCNDGQFTEKACPDGQVINTAKRPPWKCEAPEVAGMSTECKLTKPAKPVQ